MEKSFLPMKSGMVFYLITGFVIAKSNPPSSREKTLTKLDLAAVEKHIWP